MPVKASACPLHTAADWQAFLDEAASHQKWVETCEDSTCDADYYAFVRDHIDRVLRSCAGILSTSPRLAACTANLRRFLPSWMHQHDADSYGFNVPNKEYFREQETPDKPAGMMTPPPAIMAALPDRDRVEEAARRSGLKYLTHDSALGGYRTFVLISDPAGRWDQWMLLNLQKGQSHITDDMPVSVLTVQKADAAGNPLPRVRVHFRDYFVSRRADGSFESVLSESANGKCYSCHANGVRQLIARRTPILEARPVAGEVDYAGRPIPANPPDFGYRRLMEFNKRLRSYGGADWAGQIVPENHGPALGKAQGCIGCHNGNSRGILTVSTSPAQLKQKMIDELSMPPEGDAVALLQRSQVHYPTALSQKEEEDLDHAFADHDRLASEFLESRYPALKAWLLATPCR